MLGSGRLAADPSPERPRGHALDVVFVLLPLCALGAGVVACRIFGLDLACSRWFFDHAEATWSLAERQPWQWLYRYGCWPPLLLGVGGLLVAFCGPRSAAALPRRQLGAFLAVTLALGPGLAVNAALKPAVGRPRPCETAPFGGPLPFVAVGDAWGFGESRSFPSGHAAMGFFVATPALWAYRRRPLAAAGMLAGGLLYGALMGVARIGQGGHFVSDVCAAGFCVYACGVAALFASQRVSSQASSPWAT
jgi:membrane-associated PAP2 superfamily phosphatase